MNGEPGKFVLIIAYQGVLIYPATLLYCKVQGEDSLLPRISTLVSPLPQAASSY
jgi:hypothetical protein